MNGDSDIGTFEAFTRQFCRLQLRNLTDGLSSIKFILCCDRVVALRTDADWMLRMAVELADRAYKQLHELYIAKGNSKPIISNIVLPLNIDDW